MYKLLIFLFLFGCNSYRPVTTPVVTDTIYIPKTDTLLVPAQGGNIELAECNVRADSLNRLLAIERYKIERIKYYVSIVDKNSSQLQFLRGWIKRAIK